MTNDLLRAAILRALVAGALVATCGPSLANQDPAPDLSLEELLNVDVLTASRKAQRMHDIAAAVFVVTREDIERSGATSLPEALRLVPGVEVAQMASNRWAVSVRGFNGRFANKLLVLLDGRSIYSPLFSGTMWEREDTLLEDIDRIEVIRGPGAAMWGSNAVNGVINIITRKARDTQGTMITAGAGSEERAFGSVRHGGAVGDGHYRIWAKGFDRGPAVDNSGTRSQDEAKSARVGFRADWPLASGARIAVSGGAHRTTNDDVLLFPDLLAPTGIAVTPAQQIDTGAHLLARHEWVLGNGDEMALQAYVEHTHLDFQRLIDEKRTTVDFDFQHRLTLGRIHDVIWGLGYRHSSDRIQYGRMVNILPTDASQTLLSGFVQDEITVVPEKLRAIVGARLEHNTYTGTEPQPNVRLVYTPSPTQTLWGAVSRAVRIPSRAERDASVDLAVFPATAVTPPILLRNQPSTSLPLDSERLTGWEIGYRHQFEASASLDVVAFHNDYDRLRGAFLGSRQIVMTPFPHVVQTMTTANSTEAKTRGVEITADWRPLRALRVQGSYSYLDTEAHGTTGDPYSESNAKMIARTAPSHLASLRASLSLSDHQQVDAMLRYTSAIHQMDFYGVETRVPGHTALDLRYAFRPQPGLEIALVGKNLLESRHAEFRTDYLPSQSLEVQRSFYVKVKWQF